MKTCNIKKCKLVVIIPFIKNNVTSLRLIFFSKILITYFFKILNKFFDSYLSESLLFITRVSNNDIRENPTTCINIMAKIPIAVENQPGVAISKNFNIITIPIIKKINKAKIIQKTIILAKTISMKILKLRNAC